MTFSTAKISPPKCVHCGDSCFDPVEEGELSFCCSGCLTVYQILDESGLSNFYSLSSKPGIRPSHSASHRFDFLDAEEVVESLLDYHDAQRSQVTISLPSIHCIACVWLLENLNRMSEGVISSLVNFSRRQAVISFNPNTISLKELALLLDRIGYTPQFERAGGKKTQRDNSLITRIAVAGFCMGNIMLLTFPEYFVEDVHSLGSFRPFFAWLILAFSLPVLLYSSVPFIKSAWKTLRAKQVNFDIPIALGIVVLFSKSLFDILSGNGPGYMDSFAAFVFLLCIGRWFQGLTYDSLSFDSSQETYLPMAVQRMNPNGKFVMTPIGKLQPGDIIQIRDHEITPADGLLQSTTATFDFSFITGEAQEIQKVEGEKIYAGGKSIGAPILIKLTRDARRSYLNGLWQSHASKEAFGSSISHRINAWSPHFLVALGIISLSTAFVWAYIDSSRIAEIVTAVLIVACPCALALSPSFIYGHMQRFFGKGKFFLRQAKEVENLAAIDTVVFDKTGTLSHGFSIAWNGESLDSQTRDGLRAMTANSNQPLSRAIHEWLGEGKRPKMDDFQSIPGAGLMARIDNRQFNLGSAHFTGQKPKTETCVFVNVADRKLGHFSFQTRYRPNIASMFESLAGHELHLISGDNEGELVTMSRWFEEDKIHFKQDPRDKKIYVQKLQANGRKVAFVGDGLNDGGAIDQADVGIAIVEDLYQFTPAADAILLAEKLTEIPTVLRQSHYALRALKNALIFSLVYNILGLGFAVTGTLTPLVAAVIMPLSSISVVIFSWIVTRKYFLQRHS